MLLALFLFAAEPAVQSQAIEPVAFSVVNFSELADHPQAAPMPRIFPRPGRSLRAGATPDAAAGIIDSAVPAPSGPSPLPVTSFLGFLDDLTTDPPDTDGAVGPNHVVTALNNAVVVMDRKGNTLKGPIVTQTFFQGALGGANFVSDPHIWYDPQADRFLFVIDAITINLGTGQPVAPGAIIVAATQTGDPTGNWNMYQFKDPSTAVWLDFPTVGFNSKWVVVGGNMFPVGAGNQSSDLFVVDKAAVYAGQATPASTLFTNIQDFSLWPAATYDSSQSIVYVMTSFFGNAGQLKLYAVVPSSGNPTFATGGLVQTATTWTPFPPTAAGWAPQKGGYTLDCGDDRMASVFYKNGSLWATHTVFLPAGGSPTQAAAQWVQFTPPANLSQGATPTQEGLLLDPAGASDYCYTSLAVNKAGDVLLGGTVFSASTFPSAFYALHQAKDPAGATRLAEVYQPGLGQVAKGGGDVRWGDYSVTNADPVDGTSFWTLQEMGAASGSRWATFWAQVDPNKNFPSGGGSSCGCDLSGRDTTPGLSLLAGLGVAALILRRRRA